MRTSEQIQAEANSVLLELGGYYFQKERMEKRAAELLARLEALNAEKAWAMSAAEPKAAE